MVISVARHFVPLAIYLSNDFGVVLCDPPEYKERCRDIVV